MIVPVKNFVNESYCRDISIKSCSNQQVKRLNGEYIGSFVCFGYKKDEQDKNYTNTEAEKYNKRVRLCNAIALLLMVVYMILKDTAIYNDNYIVMAVTNFAQGSAIGMLLVGLIMSSRYGARIRAFKKKLLIKKPAL